MNKRLAGTAAIVTGASSGIGEATALALATEGATVVLAARRGDRLAATAATIEANGGRALVSETDVTDPAQAQDMIEQTVTAFGRLDILINNAGLMLLGPIVGAALEDWQRMLDLNVGALMTCAHAALPHLLQAANQEPRRVADLVNVSSVAGRVARINSGVYNASKFAVGAFSESLRQEVTKRHVRVALVEPGATATELLDHNSPKVRETSKARLGNLERLEARDIAASIVFVVTQPRHVAINELLVRPTEQEP